MKKELLNHLIKLVSYESISDNPKEIRKIFEYIDSQLGFFPFVKKEYTHNGVLSIVWSTQDTLKLDLILNAHVDVVPASKEMFKVRKKDGKLIGRGVSDMKFAIASFIHSLKELHKTIGLENVSVAMMLTSDEEKGGFNGVNYLVNKIGYRSNLVIIPDAGNNWHVTIKAKGASWIQISTKGDTAHASRPWEGKNAINALLEVLFYFSSKYSNPKNDEYITTTNIGSISGGSTPNQVPNSSSATIDVRYTAELSVGDIIGDLKKEFPEIEIEMLVDKPDFNVDKDNKYIKKWINLLKENKQYLYTDDEFFGLEHGSADHHYFAQHGIPVLMTKPNGGLIHTEEEWLDEEDFYLFAKILSKYLITLNK